jgi:hypothetical protein
VKKGNIALISSAALLWLQGELTMRKKAIITVELVDEGVTSSNSAIAEEMLQWFRDQALPAPWVKEVKAIKVQNA